MLPILIAFSPAFAAAGAAFLVSYASEHGLPVLSMPQLVRSAPAPLAPIWCEATRRWRHPVTRAFVKAPARP